MYPLAEHLAAGNDSAASCGKLSMLYGSCLSLLCRLLCFIQLQPLMLRYFTVAPRPSKRRKTADDSAQGQTALPTGENGKLAGEDPPSTVPRNDSDPSTTVAENDDSTHMSALESSLPSIKVDEEAIAAYETSRAANAPDNARDRLKQRAWTRGQSSIYVDAFNLALENVLRDEAHLFDENELAVFEHWKSLDFEAQYLYVRLFLRKAAAWHRVNTLAYQKDISDLGNAVRNLRIRRDLPRTLVAGETSSASFTFADGIDALTDLDEAASLLMLPELRSLAKEEKVQGKNKAELLKALKHSYGTQGALRFGSCPRSVSATTTDDHSQRNSHFIRKILQHTGDCVKLSTLPFRLFERVHLIYYRSTEWTENSLTTMILAGMSRRHFPEYIVSRSHTIFPSRAAILEFETALRLQFDVDMLVETSDGDTTTRFRKLKELSSSVRDRWRELVDQEGWKEETVYDVGEGAYLRRFSPGWVYTRILHKGLLALGRFKEYEQEHELLTELLSQRLFHPARRGAWYQRKALLEENYMWSLDKNNAAGRQAAEMKRKEWRRRALRTCEQGLQDPRCHLIFHYDLQKRITKLEMALRVVKREQRDFGHVTLAKPLERVVEGVRIERDLPAVVNQDNEQSVRRSRATVWVDDENDGGECRVEGMCLNWYKSQGWKGFHSEGGVLRTLFAYLFYDILFMYVPNVFQTEFQACPLDLHTDAFYITRVSEINHRLVEIANGETARLIQEVHDRESEKQTCVVGLDWSYHLSDLLEIAACFKGEALATICRIMAEEYQQRGGGMPDLFLWNIEEKKVMFVEVKSENDRLSDTQRLWIDVLTSAGVRVELCHAVAKEIRREKVDDTKSIDKMLRPAD